MEETVPRSPNLKTCGEFVRNYVYQTNFLILYSCFREAQTMVGRVCTRFYLPLQKLRLTFIKQGQWHGGGNPFHNFFLQKVHFVLFFAYFLQEMYYYFRLRDFDFVRVLKPQQLLYFHTRAQAPPFPERCQRYFILLQSFKFFYSNTKYYNVFQLLSNLEMTQNYGCSTIAQLHQKKFVLKKITSAPTPSPRDNCSLDGCSSVNCLSDNCPPGKLLPIQLLPRQLHPKIITLVEICHPPSTPPPMENCPICIKFPLKIIASAQAYLHQRVLRVHWGKLCTVYE